MSEPRYISPMLDGFSLGQSISEHSGVVCYPAMKDDSDKRYIVKKISLPASQVQVEALLLTGAFRNARAAGAYYEELAQGVREEVRILDELAGQRGFVPYKDHQIEPMESGVGCEVYLLIRYRKTLERFMLRNPMTHLGAVNLGIDMCAALAVCREAGWLYVDLKPENIYLFGDQEYRIGDLGFVALDSLAYASLPDRYRSVYTAPEVVDAYSSLNPTMDTYALGLVLYQVYNEGKLPFDSEDARKEWFNALAVGEDIVPPRFADEEMAGIITKAIAYDPAMRWQTPAELGHALISYMQRNGAEDIPIIAPAEPEAEPAAEASAPEEEAAAVEEVPAEVPVEIPEVEQIPAENPAEEPAVEVAPAEEPVKEPIVEVLPDEVPVLEEIPEEVQIEEVIVEDTPVEASAEEPADQETPAAEIPTEEPTAEEDPAEEPAGEPTEEVTPAEKSAAEEVPAEEEIQADWIDLMDAFLAEEEDGAERDGDEPSLRQLMSDTENLEDAANLAPDEVSAETADILNFAQELIEHEAPAPVVAPEPIDVPIPEPIAIDLPEEEKPEAAEAEEIPSSDPEPVAADDEPVSELPAPEEPKARSGLWKKLLAAAAALALVVGLGFGVWYYYFNYYLQTIDSMSYLGSGTEITITVETAMDQSKLTVVCKDTYGNALEKKLENGTVTFTDLVPGSQYIFTLEPDGFNKLEGTTSVTYSTPAETQIIHLAAVTGQEPGSAIVSFGVEGADSGEWILTWSAEGVDPLNLVFTGHTATVTGLEIGKEYTFTVTAPKEVLLVGENTVKHTASDLIYGKNLSLAGYENGTITVTWAAPEAVSVDRWIVRCYNAEGYDQLREVTENTAAFDGITEGDSYTVEVIAGGMTLGIRTDIIADQSNITGFAAVLNGSTIELSWNYAGPIPEGGWKIAWSADGGTEQILTAMEHKAALSPAAPGSSYSFTIQPPEGTNLTGGTCTLDVPEAGDFSANRLDSSTIIVEMFDVPTRNNWTYATLQNAREQDTFKPGGSLALMYTVTKPYSFDSTQFETIFVIRDAEGKLVGTSSRTRVWDKLWDNGYCTETVSNLPAAAGDYTLTIYLGGGKLAELSFHIQ